MVQPKPRSTAGGTRRTVPASPATNDRPTEADVLAALVDARSALDAPPSVTTSVMLPVMATAAVAADIASELARVGLNRSRDLIERGLVVIGWR